MSATATGIRTLGLGEGLEVTIDERGDTAGTGVLLLHGGAGPRSMAGLAAALSEHAYVITPTHPGFESTPRVPWLDSVADLADAYLDLIEELRLSTVMVIGNSHRRLDRLRDGAARHQGPDQVDRADQRDRHPPRRRRPARRRAHAAADRDQPAFLLQPGPPSRPRRADRRAACRGWPPTSRRWRSYAGRTSCSPRSCAAACAGSPCRRWSSGARRTACSPADYGRAYAESFANGHFAPIAEAGHFPQIEQPGAVLGAIGDFVDNVVKPDED